MNKLKFFLLCILSPIISSGQISIDDTIMTANGKLNGGKYTFETYLHNKSSDSIALEFRLLEYDMPGDWYSQICTNALCFAAGTAHGFFNPIPPDSIINYPTAYIYDDDSTNGTATTKIVVYDPNDSLNTHATVTFIYSTEPTGLDQNPNDESLVIAPNPVKDHFNVNLSAYSQKYQNLEVYNSAGQLVRQQKIGSGQNRLQVGMSGVASGIYWVRLRRENGDIVQQKIIKQ